jgi:hypothetical protein
VDVTYEKVGEIERGEREREIERNLSLVEK